MTRGAIAGSPWLETGPFEEHCWTYMLQRVRIRVFSDLCSVCMLMLLKSVCSSPYVLNNTVHLQVWLGLVYLCVRVSCLTINGELFVTMSVSEINGWTVQRAIRLKRWQRFRPVVRTSWVQMRLQVKGWFFISVCGVEGIHFSGVMCLCVKGFHL